MRKFKKGIVVTGSIGSGKSTVCTLLKLHGYSVIDADEIAHEVLQSLADEISIKFKDVVKNGKVDRKKLGEIVFADKDKLSWLEELLHPKIRDEIYAKCEILEDKNIFYFVDIPLYFERKGVYECFEKVVVVYASKEELIKRVIKRNELDSKAAKSRVNLQIDIEEKRKMANFIIDNSSDLLNLEASVNKFLNDLKGKANVG
ncbi:dephospho-CoA kinase [Campylobacter californiensis]|uniref:dephospho-CoA kinase n=1 Tax=Campylobacter californiensis TaxID=1032243 RepID=UPI001473F73E|nr:dephospho-CoA kinase [Campylobacter sp. RM12916]MBE3610168.1 dephospho-CoA kinase [Campylobacter sp. RM12916]